MTENATTSQLLGSTARWTAAVRAQESAREDRLFNFYLPNESIVQILDQVTDMAAPAPGSWMGFDINNSAMMTSQWTREWVEMQAKMGAPWIGTMDDPQGFLGERGWKASLSQPGAPDANYGRWTLPVLPVLMPDFPHNWFVTAVKEAG